jgi:hypothetical protein
MLQRIDGMNSVPLLWRGRELNSKTLQGLIQKSRYSNELAEGVYVRIEDEHRVLDRYKFRRDTFVAGREGFGHSKENNKLAE